MPNAPARPEISPSPNISNELPTQDTSCEAKAWFEGIKPIAGLSWTEERRLARQKGVVLEGRVTEMGCILRASGMHDSVSLGITCLHDGLNMFFGVSPNPRAT